MNDVIVDSARVFFRFNNGNLIQFGSAVLILPKKFLLIPAVTIILSSQLKIAKKADMDSGISQGILVRHPLALAWFRTEPIAHKEIYYWFLTMNLSSDIL